jgi:hypothetical protein
VTRGRGVEHGERQIDNGSAGPPCGSATTSMFLLALYGAVARRQFSRSSARMLWPVATDTLICTKGSGGLRAARGRRPAAQDAIQRHASSRATHRHLPQSSGEADHFIMAECQDVSDITLPQMVAQECIEAGKGTAVSRIAIRVRAGVRASASCARGRGRCRPATCCCFLRRAAATLGQCNGDPATA